MRKRSLAAVVFVIGALVVAAAAAAGSAHHASPTKLTIWVGWSADNKIVAAIRSGNAPDVVSSFNSYNVGNYCGTGAWIDLTPLMKKDGISASMFPAAPQYYTQYGGKRCALPLLADDYGLYYN